jgi:hypothetical protein
MAEIKDKSNQNFCSIKFLTARIQTMNQREKTFLSKNFNFLSSKNSKQPTMQANLILKRQKSGIKSIIPD